MKVLCSAAANCACQFWRLHAGRLRFIQLAKKVLAHNPSDVFVTYHRLNILRESWETLQGNVDNIEDNLPM